MLAGMQTFEEHAAGDPDGSSQVVTVVTGVVTAFEACAAFAGRGDGSPECAACGWLETEHDGGFAGVRVLAPRRRPGADDSPRRLAS